MLWVFLFGKYVWEAFLQGTHNPFLGIDIHGFLVNEIVCPDVIQPGHVIPVFVGKKDGIQLFGPGPQHLLPEIRSGIDDQHLIFMLQEHG